MQLQQKIRLLKELVIHRVRCSFPRRAIPRPDKRKKVLLVRLDRIGDFALYAPFASALRKRFPAEQYEITLLGRSIWMPLAQKLFSFEHWLTLDPQNFLDNTQYRHETLRELATSGFDYLLQARFYREALVEDLIAMAINAPSSLAFSTSKIHFQPKLLRCIDGVYADRVDSAELLQMHELDRNWAFLKSLKFDFNGGELDNPWLNPAGGALPKAEITGKYVVILPGSGKAEKCIWPPERFGQLARRASLAKFQVVLAGTADESELAKAVIQSAGINNAINLTGKQSIEEFAGLLQGAELVIGNDSGGIHMAAMSGIPSLVIAGQGQPGAFLPYPNSVGIKGICRPLVLSTKPLPCAGCKWSCTQTGSEKFRCLNDIPVEEARLTMEKLLAISTTGTPEEGVRQA